MRDLISRQAAYDALMAEPLKWDDSSVWESARCHQWMMDMDVIKALPSAPEHKTGKWIPVTKIYKVTEDQFPKTHIEWVDATEPDEIDAVRCSECGEVFDFQDARNWCTECGADMRGEQDE